MAHTVVCDLQRADRVLRVIMSRAIELRAALALLRDFCCAIYSWTQPRYNDTASDAANGTGSVRPRKLCMINGRLGPPMPTFLLTFPCRFAMLGLVSMVLTDLFHPPLTF